MTVKRAYADTPEGQVHYRWAGQGDPLILLHYSPSCGRQYEATLPLFAARGYRAIAPDLMGYGDSDKPDRPWTIPDYAANLGHLLDALGIERAFLAGGHTSAAIVAEYVADHPERAIKVVLDGSPLYTPEERQRHLDDLHPLEISDDGAHLLWAWDHVARAGLLERRYLSTLDLLKAGRTYHVGYQAVFSHDAIARLPLLTLPVLALTATEDPLFVKHPLVKQLLPHAEEHVFPGRTPLATPERAAEFVEPVDRFLRA